MHPSQRKPRPRATAIFTTTLPGFVSIMKNHHHNGPIHPTSREVIHTAISVKAYDLWERGGRPDNQAEAMWLEAERDLIAVQSWNQSETLLPVSF